MREWQDWDENIQGQRPAKPKTDTLASFILLLIIIMICVGGILAWKYQEVIKDSLNWFDNEITISSQVIDDNNNSNDALTES